MRIICKECLGTAVIRSSTRISDQVTDLYCNCKDPECGHTFIQTLAFKHTISPSSKMANNMVLDYLKDMPKNQQQEIFKQLQ